MGIISGPLADRWGARPLVFVGMLLVGGGFALASVARTLLEVYLAYGLGVGLGVGCAYVPAVAVVQRWFVKRRGFASGLAVSGIGVGTLAMPPLAAWLIDAVGWRSAYLALGSLTAVIGVGMSLLIANEPRDKGTGPDGAAMDMDAPLSPVAGVAVGEAIRSPQFTCLYIACLISSFGVFVPFVHLVPYALDHQVSASSAVLLIGAIGVGSTVARFCLGTIADRMGRQPFLLAMFVGMAAALGIWALAAGFWPLAAFAFLFGLFYGGWVAILPAVIMDHFGGRNVSTILGILYTSAAIGTLVGPSAAGFMFDASGSYLLPILVTAVANLVAAGVASLAARPSASPAVQEQAS